jgi:hypothetical protein
VEECTDSGEKKIRGRDFGTKKNSKDEDQLIFRG